MTRLFSCFLALALLTIISCSSPEEPYFDRMENVKLQAAALNGNVSIKGDAIIVNPNAVSAQLDKMDLIVFVEGNQVAEITQNENAQLAAGKENAIPVVINMKLKDVFKDIKTDWMSLLGSSLQNKEVKYKIEGDIWVNLAGQSIKLPFDYEDVEPLRIKR